jgi:uncharacterized protein YcbK (DUF882 family)
MSHEDEARLMHLFRCKRSGHQRKPDQGLLQIIAKIGAQYPGHVIELVSAHRAIPFAVRTSKHWSGHAMDFRIRGVKPGRCPHLPVGDGGDRPMGVGHYHKDGFLHVDDRRGEPSIGWDVRRAAARIPLQPALGRRSARDVRSARGRRSRTRSARRRR